MTTVEVFAPAKINLTLHVTGRRDDGYHLLDSLVVFADLGDMLRIGNAGVIAETGRRATLSLSGPECHGVPDGSDNLAARAVDMLVGDVAARIELVKTLPTAAGIGGGSADAAAAIRGVARLWNMGAGIYGPNSYLNTVSLGLGADVPMCLDPRPWRASGIGEQLEAVNVPQLDAVLVNPRVQVPTGKVFAALATTENAPMNWPPRTGSVEDFCDWLALMRNDLERPARSVAPVIADVLDELSQLPGILLARMSGSGATCFAIFKGAEAATEAANLLSDQHPDWWIRTAKLGDMSEKSTPLEVR